MHIFQQQVFRSRGAQVQAAFRMRQTFLPGQNSRGRKAGAFPLLASGGRKHGLQGRGSLYSRAARYTVFLKSAREGLHDALLVKMLPPGGQCIK